jgi:hypothetical protein
LIDEKWHRIEKGRALSDDEIGFVVELVMGWIGEQNCLKIYNTLNVFSYNTMGASGLLQ